MKIEMSCGVEEITLDAPVEDCARRVAGVAVGIARGRWHGRIATSGAKEEIAREVGEWLSSAAAGEEKVFEAAFPTAPATCSRFGGDKWLQFRVIVVERE